MHATPRDGAFFQYTYIQIKYTNKHLKKHGAKRPELRTKLPRAPAAFDRVTHTHTHTHTHIHTCIYQVAKRTSSIRPSFFQWLLEAGDERCDSFPEVRTSVKRDLESDLLREEQKRPAYFSVPQCGVEFGAVEGSVAESEAREFSRVGVLVLCTFTHI